MTEISDEKLMVMFQEGDIHAFELLFEKYRVPIFNFLYRMLNRQRGLAEDLLQEIFMKVFGAREYYEPRARFSTWLFTIARNHCLNLVRSRRYLEAKDTVSLDTRASENGSRLADNLPARDEGQDPLAQQEVREVLERVIAVLPENYREVFLLHAVEGFTHQEISEILNMNPATVRTHYHRARMILVDRMEDILEEEGRER